MGDLGARAWPSIGVPAWSSQRGWSSARGTNRTASSETQVVSERPHRPATLVQWMIPQNYEGHGGADSPARINQTDVASSSRSHPFQRSHNLAPRPSLLQCNQASFAWETQPLRLCNSTIRIELIDQFDARTNSLILMLCIDCKDINQI